jgi:hypothetical protein
MSELVTSRQLVISFYQAYTKGTPRSPFEIQ